MDLLSQRYANPYIILNDFIRLGQLHDFSNKVMNSIADEKVQKIRWEFYLHKVFDMTYEDYLAACESKPEQHEMTDQQKTDILEQSSNILNEFNL